jgi:excisionase family DNA binding protein
MNRTDTDFLTVQETARILRIGKDTAYAAIHSGAIPSIRIGKQIRVSRRVLDSLADGEPDGEGVKGRVLA